ncbi:hypothetical protein HDU91_004941 [Kappamyces sp. JEL0680]|nr:hypothetical protein HDU91_004941 [Kappamyces sp. JEL0680]
MQRLAPTNRLEQVFTQLLQICIFLYDNLQLLSISRSTLMQMAANTLQHEAFAWADVELIQDVCDAKIVELRNNYVVIHGLGKGKWSKSRKDKVTKKLVLQFKAMLAEYHGKTDETASGAVNLQPPKKVQSLFELVVDPALQLETSASYIVELIRSDPAFRDRVKKEAIYTTPGRTAVYHSLDPASDRDLQQLLQGRQPYLHQAQAWQALEANKSVLLATATSSGKSLVFQYAVLRAIKRDPDATCLLIFPTKALAQDQIARLKSLAVRMDVHDVAIAAIDGDVRDKDERRQIRDRANILLTNPDTLHVLLPHFHSWKRFFQHLKYIVVDEVHYYDSTLGLGLAFVLARLARLQSWLGLAPPQLIACSATIANPLHHAKALFGVEEENLAIIDQNGSPSAARHHIVWNPPPRPTSKENGYYTKMEEGSLALALLTRAGLRTLCFCKTRQQAELVHRLTLKYLRDPDSPLRSPYKMRDRILVYRGGYTASLRREIERKLFDGRLTACIATCALELGIDIGTVDAVIHVGFPWSLASYHQQLGRAGRRDQESLSILVTDPTSPIDREYARDPELLFGSGLPAVVFDEADQALVEVQLSCAAQELPLRDSDQRFFAHIVSESMFGKVCQGGLRFDPVLEGYLPKAKWKQSVAYLNPLRNAIQEKFRLLDPHGNLIEEIDLDRVPYSIYQSAIHLHLGSPHIVVAIDMRRKRACAEPVNVEYVTKATFSTSYEMIDMVDEKRCTKKLALQIGYMRQTKAHTGYQKLHAITGYVFEQVDAPFHEDIHATVFGLSFKFDFADLGSIQDHYDALHGLGHLILRMGAASFSVSKAILPHCHSAASRILFYDTLTQPNAESAAILHLARNMVKILQSIQTALHSPTDPALVPDGFLAAETQCPLRVARFEMVGALLPHLL